MSTKCPKGKSCSCGGKGRWEPMCEGIEEYVNQDTREYPRERIFYQSKTYVYSNKKEENIANSSDLCFVEDAYAEEKDKYYKTEECKYLCFLTKRNIYRCYKGGVITEKQYMYIRKYFFWRMSYREIATFYGKSPSTIWESVQRGIKRLKEYLLK